MQSIQNLALHWFNAVFYAYSIERSRMYIIIILNDLLCLVNQKNNTMFQTLIIYLKQVDI